jgi:hypothetical protein
MQVSAATTENATMLGSDKRDNLKAFFLVVLALMSLVLPSKNSTPKDTTKQLFDFGGLKPIDQ